MRPHLLADVAGHHHAVLGQGEGGAEAAGAGEHAHVYHLLAAQTLDQQGVHVDNLGSAQHLVLATVKLDTVTTLVTRYYLLDTDSAVLHCLLDELKLDRVLRAGVGQAVVLHRVLLVVALEDSRHGGAGVQVLARCSAKGRDQQTAVSTVMSFE